MRLIRPFAVVAVVAVLGILVYGFLRGTPVPVYSVHSAPLVQYVVATGRVAALSNTLVGTEVIGVVHEVHVDEADLVQPGDLLFTLSSDDLHAKVREARAALAALKQSRLPQAQARLRQAQAQVDQARREAVRRQQLLESKAIPREAKEQADQALTLALANLEQVELEVRSLSFGDTEEIILQERLTAAQAALDKTMVRSQVAGEVLHRSLEPGDLVQPGKVLIDIARGDGKEIRVPVDERNLSVLKTGQSAVCVPDAYPNLQFPAVVRELSRTIDPQRGTIEVKLDMTAPPDYLRYDMTVTATIETGRVAQAIVVPNQALFDRQADQANVWVLRGGRADLRSVTVGLRGIAHTQVVSGLEPGERVILDMAVTQGQRVVASSDSTLPVAGDAATRRETPVKFN